MTVSKQLPNEGGDAGRPFEDAAVRCERAVSELRYGRPVLMRTASGRIAAFALDAASRTNVERFAKAAGDAHALYLTVPSREQPDV